MTFEPTRRTVVIAGVWSAPAIVAAAAVPAVAASPTPKNLAIEASGPLEQSGQTIWVLRVINTEPTSIAANTLTIDVPKSAAYTNNGFSASNWERTVTPTSPSTIYTYRPSLAGGGTAEALLLVFNAPGATTPRPVARTTTLAPGYTPVVNMLEVRY